MSDQNRLDELIKKYLHYWDLLIAACSKVVNKAKHHAVTAAAFVRRYAKLLADKLKKYWDVVSGCGKEALQKLAAWLLKARAWVRQKWEQCVKPLLQKAAAWLLMVREKADPAVQKVKVWFAGLKERFAALTAKVQRYLPAKPKELPPAEAPAEVTALPVAEEVILPEAQAVVEDIPVKNRVRQSRITDPALLKILAVLGVTGKYVKLVIKWIWKLRTVFMAIPVIWAAVKLAIQNMDRLPDYVGLDIQSSGEFAQMITKTEAVVWPLGITAFCLVLMFCSKKPLLPWVISIFTLVLPVLIWVLNFYA